MYKKVKDGVFFHLSFGRLMKHQGYSTSIHWSQDMIDYLRQHFATMLNEELAGCIGVSKRTMIRKARELGLSKNKEWLDGIWKERRQLAQAISKKKGNPGGFKKGERRSPATEFKKGVKQPLEIRQKACESMKEWYRWHPKEASAKALKAWETRRSKV